MKYLIGLFFIIAIPVLFKESLGGNDLPEERIEGASLAFAEYWLDNFEMMRRGKK